MDTHAIFHDNSEISISEPTQSGHYIATIRDEDGVVVSRKRCNPTDLRAISMAWGQERGTSVVKGENNIAQKFPVSPFAK